MKNKPPPLWLSIFGLSSTLVIILAPFVVVLSASGSSPMPSIDEAIDSPQYITANGVVTSNNRYDTGEYKLSLDVGHDRTVQVVYQMGGTWGFACSPISNFSEVYKLVPGDRIEVYGPLNAKYANYKDKVIEFCGPDGYIRVVSLAVPVHHDASK